MIKAVDSILRQVYRNFEFIIINDGSGYECTSILENYALKDDRIVLIHNNQNIGLTKSLNIALKNAKGKYVFRMDSDDYANKMRIKRQVLFLEKHTDVDILNAGVCIIGQDIRVIAMFMRLIGFYVF